MITGVLLLVALLLMIFMAIRDKPAFFNDPLKVAMLIIVLVAAIVAWLPLRWAH